MTRSVLDDVPGLGPTAAQAAAQGVRVGEEDARAGGRGVHGAAVVARRGGGRPVRPSPRRTRHPMAPRHGRSSAILGVLMSSPPPASGLDVTVITGMSGAGRSEAADVLEDLGFFVIDNLPPALIGKVAELARGGGRPHRYGLVVDVRSGVFIDDLGGALADLRATGARTRVLFLDASDDDARAPVRSDPPAAPARGHGPGPRGHPEGARAARRAQRERRRRPRHVTAQRARAARPSGRAVQRGAVVAVTPGQHRELRLQARAPARRRPRVRLPLPAEPALDRRAAPARRARRPRCGTTCWASPRRRRSSKSCAGCSRSRSPRSSEKGSRTSRSRSGARAAATAASRSRRSSATLLVPLGSDPSVRHRDVDRV